MSKQPQNKPESRPTPQFFSLCVVAPVIVALLSVFGMANPVERTLGPCLLFIALIGGLNLVTHNWSMKQTVRYFVLCCGLICAVLALGHFLPTSGD